MTKYTRFFALPDYVVSFLIASAFWMIFGGTDKKPETVLADEYANTTLTVDGYGKIDELLFSMFRLTMVDDYDYAVRITDIGLLVILVD